MASSSSSSSVPRKFQVFLSFRGEDTRNNFTSHLHEALKRKGIDTFVDYRLEQGEKIETLLTVIEESTISIIVLSKNYASSSWCLDELSKILECKKTMGQKVVPIFYHVDPSDVRHMRGSFEKALEEQQERFKDKVERWRAALVEVADLSGFHLPGHPTDRFASLESKVVEKIAQDISKKLICKSFFDTKGLVGIDSHVEKIESLLDFDSKDVRIVGIWGMGGIGKTTIAEVVYNRFFAEFEGYCFVNVTEGELKDGRVPLRQKLFSNILGEENLNISTSLLPAFIIYRLQRKKVFFVLDDVNDPEQLDLLSLKFGCGSRIIITSRDKQLLNPVVDEWYEVKGLIDNEALQLFSLCAFKQNHPKDDFVELSKEIVCYAGGVPLALRVFGSSLYGKKLEFWKGEMKKLKEIPNPKIDKILRISYDGLDGEVKNMFLDIACFFNWENRDYVEDLLDGCYISVISGIGILIDRSLLTISFDNKIRMHDLLQQMAWNIIRQESKKSGKRSRLWTLEDICHVLENNTGTESVKGMLLDMSKFRRRVLICPTAFARMYNLNFLKFYYSDPERKTKLLLENGLVSLPGSLSCLQWDEYPSKSLPSNFCPEYLVELRMPRSHIEQLWDGVQNLVKLKFLDLTDSQYLIKLPDLSNATNLKKILLSGCKKLENFQCSVGWRSLETLSLRGCSNITKFPEIPENVYQLELSGTAIEEVPSSIGRVSRLKGLNMSYCERLERLPSSICKLKSLFSLNFYGCLKLGSFPEISETMESLEYLDLSYTSIEELHSSIENLVHLSELELNDCEKLKNLPSSIRELKSLESLELRNCSNVTKISEIPSNLKYLSLEGTSIEQLPLSINKLLQLRTLDLRYCERLQSLPPELPPNLEYLYAHDCKSLKEVSIALSISGHKEQTFIFTNCLKLDRNCINWVKSPLSIQQRATKDVNSLSQKKVKLHEDYDEEPILKSSVSIYFPGSEIPEWFRCKSQGSSVTIQLPPHLHVHNKLVGVDVCVVLAFPDDFNDLDDFFYEELYVSYRYNFKTNQRGFNEDVFNKPIRGLLNRFETSTALIDTVGDHVFLGYDLDIYHCWYNEEIKHHLTEASFEFSVYNPEEEDLSDYRVVKECGVCLLYAQDDVPHEPSEESNALVIQPSSSYDPTQLSLKCGVINQDSVEPMVEDGTVINHESGSFDLNVQPSTSYDPNWLSLKCGLINQDFVEPMVEDGTIINHESGSFDLNVQPSTSYDPNWLSLKFGVINQDSVDPLVEEKEPQRKRLKFS